MYVGNSQCVQVHAHIHTLTHLCPWTFYVVNTTAPDILLCLSGHPPISLRSERMAHDHVTEFFRKDSACICPAEKMDIHVQEG